VSFWIPATRIFLRSFRRVLLFVEGGESVDALLPEVEKLVPGDAVVYSLRVYDLPGPATGRDAALPSLDRALLARPGPPFAPYRIVRRAADPANCILETARLLEIGLIVLGISRPGFWKRLFRPSLAPRVIQPQGIPVLLLPLQPAPRGPELRRVLVPVHPSGDPGRTLLQLAPPLCRRTGAEVVLMGLFNLEQTGPEEDRVLDHLNRDLSSAGCRTRRVDVTGEFVGQILSYVRSHEVDLMLLPGSLSPPGAPPQSRASAPRLLFRSGCPILVHSAA
jgi:nucleotide-binding universal stress UspA family protein